MVSLATVICLLFVLYLMRSDVRKSGGPLPGLWVPLAWMFLAGSRWVSSWLNLGVPLQSANDYADGSPVDRAVFFTLIVAGAVILSRRKIDWAELLGHNKWIALYFLYCLASIAWA